MTQYPEEVAYLWQRAASSLEAAGVLIERGLTDAVANRAYYAVFYAASTLFLVEGGDFSKHTAVRAHLHKAYIKPGRLPEEVGAIYDSLFALRDVGDYGVSKHVSMAEASQAIAKARSLLDAVRALLPPEVLNQQ